MIVLNSEIGDDVLLYDEFDDSILVLICAKYSVMSCFCDYVIVDVLKVLRII